MPVAEGARPAVTSPPLSRTPHACARVRRLRPRVGMSALPIEACKHERHFSAKVLADGLNPVARLHSLEDVLNEMGGSPAIAAGETVGREHEQDGLPVLGSARGSTLLRVPEAGATAAFVRGRGLVVVLTRYPPSLPSRVLAAALKLRPNRAALVSRAFARVDHAWCHRYWPCWRITGFAARVKPRSPQPRHGLPL